MDGLTAIVTLAAGTAGAAVIKLIDGVIQWKLARKARAEDRAEDADTAEEQFKRDVNERLDSITDKLHAIEFSQRVERKQNIRRSILRFSDECRIGTHHSREMFTNALADIDEYYELCKDTGDPNEVIKEAIEYIREVNHQCLIQNNYL
jgi:hypothetical protein